MAGKPALEPAVLERAGLRIEWGRETAWWSGLAEFPFDTADFWTKGGAEFAGMPLPAREAFQHAAAAVVAQRNHTRAANHAALAGGMADGGARPDRISFCLQTTLAGLRLTYG